MDSFVWSLRLIIGCGLIVFILILLLEINHLKAERQGYIEKINTLSQEINDQDAAIDEMNIETINKQKQIQLALKEAVKARDNYNIQAKKILAEKISSNCEKAIRWGAIKGSQLYLCWVTK